jgi:hypothetical protein
MWRSIDNGMVSETLLTVNKRTYRLGVLAERRNRGEARPLTYITANPPGRR